MSKLSVVYPANISPIDGTFQNDYGVGFTIDEDLTPVDYTPEYQLFMKRAGDLNEVNKRLLLKVDDGNVGGRNVVYTAQESLLPMALVSPFKFAYQIDTNDANAYIGQSADSVKDYLSFSLYIDGTPVSSTLYREFQMLSKHEDLFLICEGIETIDSVTANMVHIWKYSKAANRFNRVLVLPDIIDLGEVLADTQKGSPSFCLYDSEIMIAYRQKTNSLFNSLIVYRFDGVDEIFKMVELEVVNEKIVDYTDFRLRISSGGDAICLVYSGVGTEDINDNLGSLIYSTTIADMRSYTSLDGGYSFISYNDTVSNVVINNSLDVESSFGTSSLASMFIPYFTRGKDETYYTDMGVKFDLYYDTDMASFVILKPGDPDTLFYERSYIVGVKTSEANPLVWEPCLNYQVLREFTGEINHDAEDPLGSVVGGGYYKVEDIAVCDGGGYRYAVIHFTRQVNSESGSHPTNSGIAVMQFKFVHNDEMPRGNYPKIVGYGGKYHKEYTFITTIADMDTQGLIHTGDWPNSVYNFGHDPICCMWLNQMVATARMDENADEYCFLAVHAPWSNLGEDYGYQSCYTRYVGGDVELGDWIKTALSSGVVGYNATDKRVTLSAPAGGDYAYLLFGNAGISPGGSLISRCSYGNTQFFKVRFQIKFEGSIGTDFQFFSARANNSSLDRGYGLKMYVDSLGAVTATNYTNTVNHGTIDNIDLTKAHEYYVSVGFIQNRQIGLTIWRRSFPNYWSDNDVLWTPVYTTVLAPETGLGSSDLRIGILNYTTNPGYSVSIGDLKVSSYGGGYAPTLSDKNYWQLPDGDPASLYHGSPSQFAPPFASYSRQYGKDVYLRGGDIISFKGGEINDNRRVSHILSMVEDDNTPLMLIDRIPSSAWNMLSGYTYPDYANIYLRSESKDIDTLGVFNISGVHSIDVKRGVYDELLDTWSFDVDDTIDLDYNVILVSDYDNTLIEVSLEFGENEIEGATIFAYDTVNSIYIESYDVVRSFDSVLQLDRAFVYDADYEYRLFKREYILALPEAIADLTYTDFLLTFNTVSAPIKYEIGQIVLGEIFNIEDVATELTVSNNTTEKVLDGQTGLAHRTNRGQLYHYKSYSFESPYINPYSGLENHYNNMLLSFHARNKPFAFKLEYDDGTSLDCYGVLETASIAPDKAFETTSFTVNVPSY